MYSGRDTLEGVGFPIRTSADQRSLASPRGFSQRATSFIASWRQGIHRTPLSRSISHHHRPHAGPNRALRPNGRAIPIAQLTHSQRTCPSAAYATNQSIFTCQRTPAGTNPSRDSNAMRRSWKRASRSQAVPSHPAASRRTSRTTHRAIAHDALAPCIRTTHPVITQAPSPRNAGLEATGFEPMTPCLQSRCSTS